MTDSARYVQLERCGNCGTANAELPVTVIDWRTDRLCLSCDASFEWPESDWHSDGLTHQRLCGFRTVQGTCTLDSGHDKGSMATFHQEGGRVLPDEPAITVAYEGDTGEWPASRLIAARDFQAGS